MAKEQAQSLGPRHWMKASELQVLREEAPHTPLYLNRLSSFFPAGLQRGCIAEFNGPKTSGKISLSLYVLAESICKGEVCAYVDLSNQFSPAILAQTGMPLHSLSWVRCNGNTEHAMQAADLLLHAGGFGVVLLDLCRAMPQTLNRIPLSYWFRFQRAIENTPTILLVCAEQQLARSCSRYALAVQAGVIRWKGEAPFTLLDGLELLLKSDKPAQRKVTSIRPETLWIEPHVLSGGVA